MSKLTYQPRGRYFEQFEVGQELITAARTITEADIVNFAGMTGDYNQIHTDAEFAAKDTFGQRIAHGLLVQSIATGLAVQSGIIEGTVLAFRELSAKFSLPVFIGDTVHVELKITETKPLRRLGGGNINMKYAVYNQHGKAVQRGDWVMLIKSQNNS
ncbi:MaoC/PaaZ C-terminal domain-containing protein [Candidatus Leptofilum sp.]|uniref:MaoC/PaaZ C-terminal domain-containing protein n=1 Tax=Candidatus Leptofilum sp. TaxID=3241576 RepID=UPI003B593D39